MRTGSALIGEYPPRPRALRTLRGNLGNSTGGPHKGGRSPATGRSSNISRKCTLLPACRTANKGSSLWMSFRCVPASPTVDSRPHARVRQAPPAQRTRSWISPREETVGAASTFSRFSPSPRARRVARPRSVRLPRWPQSVRETKARGHRRSRRQLPPAVRVPAKSSAPAPLRLPS
jgi:hypothetical protein